MADFRDNPAIKTAIAKISQPKPPVPWKYETMVTAMWNSILLTYFPTNGNPNNYRGHIYLTHEYYQERQKADICLVLDLQAPANKALPVLLVECKTQAPMDKRSWNEAELQLKGHFDAVKKNYNHTPPYKTWHLVGIVACGTKARIYEYDEDNRMRRMSVAADGVDFLEDIDISTDDGQRYLHVNLGDPGHIQELIRGVYDEVK